MIKRSLFFLLLSGRFLLFGQTQDTTKAQTEKAMPKLEIPEITIVGKKAITLPFARKGEVYDINIYKAPEPDTSLIGERYTLALPAGSFPRYEERREPIRAALDGSFGSYSAGKLNAYFDYNALKWGITGRGGYKTTAGHTTNADYSAFNLEGVAYSFLNTDNDILKTLRLNVGTNYAHNKYGLFGINNYEIERARNNFALDVQLGTSRREAFTADVGLTTSMVSLIDKAVSNEKDASAFSPKLNVSLGGEIEKIRLNSELLFTSNSLDYSSQSPSLLSFALQGGWRIGSDWLLYFGGLYASGSDTSGSTKSILSPMGILKWDIDRGSELSFWFQPEMKLAGYAEFFNRIPYLVREINLRPERTPIGLGAVYRFTSELYTLELRGVFSKVLDKSVIIADSGFINIDYVDAYSSSLQIQGTLKPIKRTSMNVFAVINPAYEIGKSGQLPMTPLVRVKVRGEYSFQFPVKVWSDVEYFSRQNVDLEGKKPTLTDAILFGIGASATYIPRTVLSLEINNILNTKYYWWRSYIAPGIQFLLSAQVNVW
jgi:hypothetical protein